VKEPIVADSTSLIGLERIGRLKLFPDLFQPFVIPPEVDREVGVSFDWLVVETPVDQRLIASLNTVIDLGEAEAITLAHEKGYRVLLDDLPARAVAKRMGLRIIGTVGVLILAKQQLIISAVKPLLDELEAKNFYLSAGLRKEALRLVDE
jgi:uncharacterized protein